MRTFHLAGTVVLGVGLLAGCSSEEKALSADSAVPVAKHEARTASSPAYAVGRVRSLLTSEASLPDRGELLAYTSKQPAKHRGAYTAYPVALSEAHALNAAHAGGRLLLTAPNGEPIRLTYERHVEHEDGNWSWIGRDANGAEALLTFGERAVFGSVPQGNGNLRLMMSAGRAYLVATDRSKLAGLDGTRRRSGNDQFIPPKLSSASAAHRMAASAPSAASATAAAAAPIDVLIGYTNGFSTALGGDSAAVTRLQYLADVTNQAYLNSGVTLRVRLVKALKVNYPDNTDNGTALEKLTGYTEAGGTTPVDPAFNALRAARETVGADLVSLVRSFRAPENDGCGIAWLIGGDQQGITAEDAPFGYGVVSDGMDTDEQDSNDYFCQPETLAHELGHNMGQAHNIEDSTSPGLHPYSYGYREASATGFYTVMSYPSGDQQEGITYFANPAKTYVGRPTGVANASDNVRSMNQSMPIVASFRATVIPVSQGIRNDYNGDSRSDLIWWQPAQLKITYWVMSGSIVVSKLPSNYQSAGRSLAATGDFNGDGKSGDMIWVSSSRLEMWLATSTSFTRQDIGPVPAGWRVVGAADVDADGKSDLLWRQNATGLFTYWLMNGTTVKTKAAGFPAGKDYEIRGIGDFQGDKRADLVWTNDKNVLAWVGNGSTFSQKIIAARPQGWDLVGLADVNGDLKADLLWRNRSSGRFTFWLLDGTTVKSMAPSVPAGLDYAIRAVVDLNGDGKIDIVFDNNKNVLLWLGTGSSFSSYPLAGGRPAGWVMLDPGAR